MGNRKPDAWSNSTGLARAILHDRTERRKWLFYLVLIPLGMLAIGLWVIDEWIWANLWRVLLWWGACAVATGVVLIFALYDSLAVIREERERLKKDLEKR